MSESASESPTEVEVVPNPMRPGEPPRKIIIGTPFKGGASVNYIRFLVKSMRTKFPDREIDYVVSDSGSVAFARNEIAWQAESQNADAVAMVDEDMLGEPHHLDRLISHAEPVVAGIYCKRNAGKPYWLFVPRTGAEIRADGLLESVRLATGFMLIRTEVFRKFRDVFPERVFECKDAEADPISERIEAFPSGLVGPGTAEGRLESIRELLYGWDVTDHSSSITHLRDKLITAASGKRGPNHLRGEDYYFSKLAIKAGFKIYADTKLVLGHIGNISFPVTPEMVGIGPDKPFYMPPSDTE